MRILLVTNGQKWVFANIAHYLTKHLGQDFELTTTGRPSSGTGEYDILVCLCWENALRAIATVKAKRTIICVYDALSWKVGKGPDQFQTVVGLADAIVACNQRIFSELKKTYPTARIETITDGVDTQLFAQGAIPSPIIGGWAGNSSRHTPGGPTDLKGLSLIRQAQGLAQVPLAILDASGGNSWDLWQMPDFYAQVSYVICASAFEGTPNPILEAMSCGRPVLTTNVGIVPELVENEVNGFILEDRQPQTIARGLLQMARLSADQLHKMGSAARRAVEPWDWRNKTTVWRDLFLDITRQRPKRTPPKTLATYQEVQITDTTRSFPPLGEGTKPRILLMSDVPDWAFHVNLTDMASYLDEEFAFSHWHVIDFLKHDYVPNVNSFHGVFAPYHRWGIDGVLPWDRMLGSLRALWFKPEKPLPPSHEEYELVNRYRAFHVVTQQNYDELKDHCPNVMYLTNPVNMRRFGQPTEIDDRMVCSWNGNAKHQSGNDPDIKGFHGIIKLAIEAAAVDFVWAEYNTKRLLPSEMPEFYRQGNTAICMSKYEGASNSVMEAMAAGQALITTPVGNALEMRETQLKDFGDTGIILVDRTIDSLAQAIVKLRRDPKRIKEMGQLNRKEIERRWSWDVWTKGYREFLKKAYT